MSIRVRALISIVLSVSLLMMGCSSSKTVKGGAIGAGAGAVIGGIIGHQAGNTAVGAIIGAAVGGTAGALIGHYMDKQAEEMQRDIKNAKIERVGEGIKITFDSGLLFQTNSSRLSTAAEQNITELAKILAKYKDTDILVEGHTDSTGTDAYNQKLSEERADAVASYAKGLGVKGSRFTTTGYGETQPVASNATAEGRQKNRRVEVAIMANDDLKDAAEKNQKLVPG
jgi:outer membrane protein OmpA-like peptidoglycan-associated protein